MCGGKIHDGIHNIYEEYQIKPDISYGKNDWGEVKSCVVGNQQKLERNQLGKFASWMIHDKDPTFKFYFFQHGVYDIKKRFESKEYLLEELRVNSLFCVQTPIQVPMQFFLKEGEMEYRLGEYPSDRSGNRGYNDKSILSISSTFLRNLLSKPIETLEAIALDANDYKIQKRTVKGLNVNHRKVSPFPLLIISNPTKKSYKAWVEKERKSIEKLAEFYHDEVEVNSSKKDTESAEESFEEFNWETGEYELSGELPF
jgi:hypothetical protein